MIVPLIWSISRLSPMLMSVSPKSLAKSAVGTVRRELMVRCHGVDVADVAKLLKTFYHYFGNLCYRKPAHADPCQKHQNRQSLHHQCQ